MRYTLVLLKVFAVSNCLRNWQNFPVHALQPVDYEISTTDGRCRAPLSPQRCYVANAIGFCTKDNEFVHVDTGDLLRCEDSPECLLLNGGPVQCSALTKVVPRNCSLTGQNCQIVINHLTASASKP